jgi:hypothetical protein
MLQEDVHHFRVHIRQNQRGHLSERHAHGSVHVGERPDDLPWRSWANALGGPARGIAIIDSSESTLILCDQRNWATIIGISLRNHLGHLFRNFF